MFRDLYRGKRVLLTGHTGFKGSWLAFWLQRLGAEVCGMALPMPGTSHWELLRLDLRSEMADIRDAGAVKRIMADFQPEIVFHLAAQPLVRLSYREPAATFASNVMGTVHVLDACRATPSVKAIVAVTSDKCYENQERAAGYRETDPMGGYDPYSASKGCSELVISCFRRSFFNNDDYGKTHHTLLASARAGNVIGGGDWAEDRLVPDIMKAAAGKCTATIRNPRSTRPWQHVLEPLSGYLALGQKLLEGKVEFAEGWNFGPGDGGMIPVEEMASALSREWPQIRYEVRPPENAPHEAGLLHLDCTKARERLHWQGTWEPAETFRRTAEWYRKFYEDGALNTGADLEDYIGDASRRGLEWTK